MNNLVKEMVRWRLNYTHRTPSVAEEVRDIVAIAVLCFLLYVLVVLIFA